MIQTQRSTVNLLKKKKKITLVVLHSRFFPSGEEWILGGDAEGIDFYMSFFFF